VLSTFHVTQRNVKLQRYFEAVTYLSTDLGWTLLNLRLKGK